MELGKSGLLAKNVQIFQNVCINVLEKYVRSNQANFMDTALNQESFN